MLKGVIHRFRRASAARRLFAEAHYISDPLSHPALRDLSPRELADIPFGRDASPR